MTKIKQFTLVAGLVGFLVLSVWGFDAGLHMMNQASDLKLVGGILVIALLLFLWFNILMEIYEEFLKKLRPKKEETKKEG
jgi:hypothetical protein